MSLIDLLNKSILPLESEALIGREEEVEVPEHHFVKGTPLKGPFPDHLKQAIFGMGCFWGVERRFWELEGVYSTSAGYAGVFTKIHPIKKFVLVLQDIMRLCLLFMILML